MAMTRVLEMLAWDPIVGQVPRLEDIPRHALSQLLAMVCLVERCARWTG